MSQKTCSSTNSPAVAGRQVRTAGAVKDLPQALPPQVGPADAQQTGAEKPAHLFQLPRAHVVALWTQSCGQGTGKCAWAGGEANKNCYGGQHVLRSGGGQVCTGRGWSKQELLQGTARLTIRGQASVHGEGVKQTKTVSGGSTWGTFPFMPNSCTRERERERERGNVRTTWKTIDDRGIAFCKSVPHKFG